MIIQKGKINQILLYAILIFTVLFFAILPLRNISLRHVIVFIGTVLFYCVLFRILFFNKHTLFEFFSFSIITAIIAFGILSSNKEGILDLVYASFNFLTLFILISCNKSLFKINANIRKTIFFASILMAGCLIVSSRSPAAYVFEDGRITGALTLGMTNPNLAGMMIGCVYSLLLMQYRKVRRKYLLFPILVYLMYLIFLTDARSSIIAAIAITLYSLFFYKVDVPEFLVIMTVLIPIVTVPIYLYLFRSGWYNYQLLGKQLFSGREVTFIQQLNRITSWKQVLFGNLGSARFLNAHNGPLAIFCSIGIVGLILTYVNYIRRLIQINNNISNDEARVAIVCVLGLFVQSSAEALMFTGYFTCLSFMYLFLLIANADDSE